MSFLDFDWQINQFRIRWRFGFDKRNLDYPLFSKKRKEKYILTTQNPVDK